jgi:hypothetical protein
MKIPPQNKYRQHAVELSEVIADRIRNDGFSLLVLLPVHLEGRQREQCRQTSIIEIGV